MGGHVSGPVHALRDRATLGPRKTLALGAALFVAVFVFRRLDPNVANADSILFVVPIALVSLEFGLLGGLASGLIALAAVAAWDLFDSSVALSAIGFVSRGSAFLLLGILLGVFVDYRRRLEADIARYFDESLDLLATANRAGWFTRVNPAWERTLGISEEELCSRPFIDFVHPGDREATIAETALLATGARDTARFRNRYRAADGSYRWLEWSARASSCDGDIHAMARDITSQREADERLAHHAELLEAAVDERTRELDKARAETLQRLAFAAEHRDEGTFEHTERVGQLSADIARQLGLPAADVALLREAAPLHDVGKLAIPDAILMNPGKLTSDEFAVMQTHTEHGAELLSGSESPVLQTASVIAASHHERWDGTGYPRGLAGEAIPLVSRIVTVADVFDALTHERPYKSAWPVEQALEEIRRGAGTQFDPAVAKAFLSLHPDVAHSANSQRARRPSPSPQRARPARDRRPELVAPR